MSQVAEFDALLNILTSATRAVRDHLASHTTYDNVGHAKINGATFRPSTMASDNVRDAKRSMFEAMVKLQQMFLDPVELTTQTTINVSDNRAQLTYSMVQAVNGTDTSFPCWKFQHLSCLRWIVHFNIPAHVPLDASASYSAIANAAKVPEHQLRQIARMAMTNGLFREPSPNMLAHTTLTAHLATNPVYFETTLFQTETTTSIAGKMTEMTRKYGGSEMPNETAHNIAMETDLPFFRYLSVNPTVGARLQQAMKFVAGAEETHTAHLVEMFDWAGLGKAEVVDVSAILDLFDIHRALTNSL
jgi:hypothetical protein